MAQKQFKIGLSNTDKQNMAQDVYERLINMCFDTYNSANTYNEGDFVVYENPSDTFKLYKCLEDNVTGAWDSTKWQLATFQDLVDDIENAVAFVNDKANVDGNYPTMTVGMADNLTPYDESAGDDQDTPFNLQATGTGNGSQADFATGSAALMKEKQGNTVVVNQLVSDITSNLNCTTSNVGRTFTVTPNNLLSGINFTGIHVVLNHKYLGICSFNAPVGSQIRIDFYGAQAETLLASGNKQTIFGIFDNTYETSQNWQFGCKVDNNSNLETYEISNAYLIDLTQWFNGDIPQDILDHPSNFFRYYQGSLAYNAGELVNANGRYIKCIGRQQWDEILEVGNIDGDTGQDTSNNSSRRSKNYIPVISGKTYHFNWQSFIQDSSIAVFFYDSNKNFLNVIYFYNSNYDFVVPANASYIRFRIYYSSWTSSTVVASDITISIYYEGESGYDEYYPYQVLTNNDTGTETLRSAGSVKDSKAPDGTITRRIGVVDLGTLDWSQQTNGMFLSSALADMKLFPSANGTISQIIAGGYDYSKLICSKYQLMGVTYVNISKTEIGIWGTAGQKTIMVNDSNYNDAAAFKTAMSGVYLFYELAEPTTEQGTTYSENLVIDDFGSMDFGGANGVPQGCLIFYPVDYKAFVDTLYKYTDGTPSNLALNSELNTKFENYLKSLSGYDNTKTQTLKNVQGTLTWVDDE